LPNMSLNIKYVICELNAINFFLLACNKSQKSTTI